MFYMMFQSPDSSEEIHVYEEADMQECFTQEERDVIKKGEPLFRNGGLWIDMAEQARTRLMTELEG